MHEMCFNLNKYHCEKYIANFTKSVIRSHGENFLRINPSVPNI